MTIKRPKREDVEEDSIAIVLDDDREVLYQYERAVEWQEPEWMKKGGFDHDEIPPLNLTQVRFAHEGNGDGGDRVTVYASEMAAAMSGSTSSGSQPADDEEQDGYWVHLPDGTRIPSTSAHRQQQENMLGVVAYLVEEHDLLDALELPYTPGFARKNCTINTVEEHPDGREMRGAVELPSGDFLFTALNKQEKKDRIRDLALKAGADVEFDGEWNE